MNRGDVLARRLAASIGAIEGTTPPVGALDITFHRDDAGTRGPGDGGSRRPSHLPVGLDGKTVVLVDDVLFTGRSIRAAMDELMDYGRPRSIQLAVLVDRGHRELPIHADFVGKNVPTSLKESVAVRLQEPDGEDGVQILDRGKEA
jgi:pyrimidine operon attenuation protein/uracil phosphoribosyltransferase